MCLLLLVLAYSLSTWLELTLFATFAQAQNDNFLGISWALGLAIIRTNRLAFPSEILQPWL
jgi:hypothetical protein